MGKKKNNNKKVASNLADNEKSSTSNIEQDNNDDNDEQIEAEEEQPNNSTVAEEEQVEEIKIVEEEVKMDLIEEVITTVKEEEVKMEEVITKVEGEEVKMEEVITKVEVEEEVKMVEEVITKVEVEVKMEEVISKVEEEEKMEEIPTKIEEVKIEEVKIEESKTATTVQENQEEKAEESVTNDKNSSSPARLVAEKAQPYVKWAQTTCSTTVEVGLDLGKKMATQSVEYSKGIGKATHESLVKASEFTNASIVKANDAIVKQKQRILRERKIIKNAEIRYRKLIRFNSAIELQVDAGAVIKVPYFVPKGRCIVWKIKVKSMQLGFGLNVRTQEIGGAVETEVESLVQIDYKDSVLVGHRKACDIDRHLVFVFDNTVNKLLAKTCVYSIIQGDKAEEEWKEYTILMEKKESEKQQRGENAEDVVSDEEDDTVQEKSPEPLKESEVVQNMDGDVTVDVAPKSSWFTSMYASAQSATASLTEKASGVAKDAAAHPRVLGAVDYLKSTSLYKKYMTPANANSEQPEKTNVETASNVPILPSSSTESTNTETDGEEDKFISQSVKPTTTISNTTNQQNSLLLKENTSINMVQGAAIDPDSFSSMWSEELPDSVTIKLLVSPLEEFKYGFPIVSLAQHLQNVGMYEVARGILPTGGGVKIFSYCEGYPPQSTSEYPIMFLLESICTKQVNDNNSNNNDDQWELIITMKCTDTGYLFDFMKYIQLKSLLADITFVDPIQRLAYNQFLC